MGAISTQFSVPCTSDKALLAVQDVVDTLKWRVLEVSSDLVVVQSPTAADPVPIWGLPKISIKLREIDRSTSISVSVLVVGPVLGQKKFLTGLMGQLVNSISIRIQTDSIAITPTVAIGEGQGGPSHQPIDRIGQLTQLKALLDAGVLTQEEFDSEKTRILSQN
jgi:hypothetical protein